MSSPKKYIQNHSHPLEPNTAFVLLVTQSEDIYNNSIKKALKHFEFEVESFLDLYTAGDTLNQIWERMQKAEVIIADITGLRPNIMYELGIAMSIKEEENVIIVYQLDDENLDLPFDIAHLRVTTYQGENLEELEKKLIHVLKKIQKPLPRPRIREPKVRNLMENAISLRKDRQYVAAKTLFTQMDILESKNWYIYNEWGRLFREQKDIDAALQKYAKAVEYSQRNDELTQVYIEKALLYKIFPNKHQQTEEWFEKARKLGENNKELYIIWAEYFAELGHYHQAIDKINQILISGSKDVDAKLLFKFYNQKLDNKFKGDFEDFKKMLQKEQEKSSLSLAKMPLQSPLPWEVEDDELHTFVGKVVEGRINGFKDFGIFVSLSINFSVLIFKNFL